MRLKIAVSVVRFRPWAPLALPALSFLVRASSPISKNPRKIRHFVVLTPGTARDRPRASGAFGYTVGTLEGPGTLAGRPIAREPSHGRTERHENSLCDADGQGICDRRWPGPQRRGSALWDQAVALPLPFRRQAQEYVFWHLSRRRPQGRVRQTPRR